MADEQQCPACECEEGAPEWVVTFGDMMSLLLCFFILLLSFSETDAAKYKDVGGSLEKAFGVQSIVPVLGKPLGMKLVTRNFETEFIKQAQTNPFTGTGGPGGDESGGQGKKEDKDFEEFVKHMLKENVEKLEELEAQGIIKLEEDAEFLIVRLIGQATFASGKANIENNVIPALVTIGNVIQQSGREIVVAGHTDNIPLKGGGLYGSNLVLSAARAATIVQFFIDHGSVAPEYISMVGYGEYQPIAPNDSEENRQKNRRVDIKLSRERKIPN